MAMNGTVLGDAIVDEIIAPNAPAHMQTQIRDMWHRIGDVIVKHIQDNAKVTVAKGIAVDNLGTTQLPEYQTVEEGSGTIV